MNSNNEIEVVAKQQSYYKNYDNIDWGINSEGDKMQTKVEFDMEIKTMVNVSAAIEYDQLGMRDGQPTNMHVPHIDVLLGDTNITDSLDVDDIADIAATACDVFVEDYSDVDFDHDNHYANDCTDELCGFEPLTQGSIEVGGD